MLDEILEKIGNRELKVALIGLGYVGLPLAAEFGKYYDTIGFDIKKSRLEELRRGVDSTLEIPKEALRAAKRLRCTGDPEELRNRDVFIVTVPTPVDKYNTPDLRPLRLASETVGNTMRPGSIVIYESTVFPGCTEEECVPILERCSGLRFNRDFFCGYSPERINPGDREHTLTRILKITSGSTSEAAEAVDRLYNSILHSGTHRASSIKVAEAAKVIENSQRDINIAFVNELSKIFHRMGIDTSEVLAAAGTKWNFLNFRPGLVGGHCIGVDPFYLTYKAQSLGYSPEIILAGRRINDSMGKYVAEETVKLMIRKEKKIFGSRVLQLGITFKENCPDIRNSRASDIARNLMEFGCRVDLLDPYAGAEEVRREYGLDAVRNRFDEIRPEEYDAVVLAVAHRQFLEIVFTCFRSPGCVIYDVKSVLPRELVDGRL